MSVNSIFPNYTKLDSHGKEIIYWNALGSCGHIMLYTIQCFIGDWIFCKRCDAATQIQHAKYMRPHDFMKKFGGQLIT
jgi:hypothetical protein